MLWCLVLLSVSTSRACCRLPWVALRGCVATLSIYRDEALNRDAGMAHRAFELVTRLLEPVVDAGPAVEVSTTRENGLFGHIEANAAVEAGTTFH